MTTSSPDLKPGDKYRDTDGDIWVVRDNGLLSLDGHVSEGILDFPYIERVYGPLAIDSGEGQKVVPEPGPQSDPVNHPSHYTTHPSGVECITVTEHMNFCLGNAMKYLWRAGEKGDKAEDLRKARWYIDRELARLEAA